MQESEFLMAKLCWKASREMLQDAESSPMKDSRSKIVSLVSPPLKQSFPMETRFLFCNCSANTHIALGKHMQLNYHHKTDSQGPNEKWKKGKKQKPLPKITCQHKPKTVQAFYPSYLVKRKEHQGLITLFWFLVNIQVCKEVTRIQVKYPHF